MDKKYFLPRQVDELIKLMVNPNAAFKKASDSQGGQQATIGLLAQSMFQVGFMFFCRVRGHNWQNE